MWMSPHHKTRHGRLTIGVHVIAGIFCGVLYHWYAGLAVLLFVGFGFFEYWESQVIGDRGHKDFWEGLVGGFIGAGIIFILNLVGKI